MNISSESVVPRISGNSCSCFITPPPSMMRCGDSVQTKLLDYCIEALARKTAVEPKKFSRCFDYCCLTRNLQILGAFAFLSKVKNKHYFEDFIPAALQTLQNNLLKSGQDEFPALAAAVARAVGELKKGRG